MSREMIKFLRNTIFLSILLFTMGFSLLLSQIIDVPFWATMPSLIILTAGLWIIFLGIQAYNNRDAESNFGPEQSTYLLGWGAIISVIGLVLIISWFYPEGNLEILFGIFLLILGFMTIILNLLIYKKIKGE